MSENTVTSEMARKAVEALGHGTFTGVALSNPDEPILAMMVEGLGSPLAFFDDGRKARILMQLIAGLREIKWDAVAEAGAMPATEAESMKEILRMLGEITIRSNPHSRTALVTELPEA